MIVKKLRQMLWLAAMLVAGLLLPSHEAFAASCASATSQGTAPNDYKNYCWLDFSTYSDSAAQSAGGQAMSFSLPDGSTLTMTVRTTVTAGGSPAFKPVGVPSWTGAAFGNSAFFGIPGLPILYTAQNGGQAKVTLSNISLVPPAGSGGVANYAIVAADGESTNGGENIIFTTSGQAWTQLSKIANGTAYPTVTGVGTSTVQMDGINGQVGSYVFGSSGNPTTVSASVVASGLQGVALGLRYASISLTANITNYRIDPADQFTYAIKNTAGTVINSQTTTGTALNGFVTAGFPTLASSYPVVLNLAMASGSVSTLANYNVTLTCTNSNPGSSTVLPTNVATSNFTTPSLQYGDAVACVFTDTAYPRISGTVYNDLNHSGALDATETGTGLAGVNVKLAAFSGGTCQSPATQTVAVNTTSGAYTFPGVPYGSYCLTVTNNATLSNVTAYSPVGWLRTEAPTGIRQATSAATSAIPLQNFGLYNGTQLTAQVFADTGVTAGLANDGVKNAAESGIGAVTVNASAGGAVVGSGVTDGSGAAILWLPSTVSGTVTVAPVAPSGYVPTGGNAGTSLGTYARPSVTFTYSAGQMYTGLQFGLIPPNGYTSDGTKTVPAGTTLFYPHTYVAGSSGSVALSLASVETPTLAGWSQVLYTDAACTGTIAAGATQIIAPIVLTAGQQLCFLVKVFVPTNAPLNAQSKVTVTAVFTYSGSAAPGTNTLTHVDTTSVSLAGSMGLSKLVKNVTSGGAFGTASNASPGNTIQYLLTLGNGGTGDLSTVVVTDSTPAYTLFVSASCPGTLPSGLTACAVTTQPAVGGQGALMWTFTGTLAPGASAAVTYNVTVAQ